MAAALHWQVVWSLVAAVGLTVARVYFRHYGTSILGEPAPDKDLVVIVFSIGALTALAFAWRSASALASTVQLVSGGARTPNVLLVLKESMAFFADNQLPTGLLGPRIQGTAGPAENDGVEQRRSRRTTG